MRLLDTTTGAFVYKDPRKDVNLKYAILSHTWDPEGEQTYQELQKIQQRNDRNDRTHDQPIASSKQPSLPILAATPTLISSEKHPENSPLGLQLPTLPVLRFMWGFLALLITLILPQRFVGLVRNSYRPDQSSISSTVTSTNSDVDGPPHPPSAPISSGPPPQTEDGQPQISSTSIWDDPELSPKVREACAFARANGYQYIWIDSCCIDKTSSAELSEAINSMYAWYARAEICYAYLADVPPAADHRKPRSDFRGSLWFTRGWTLQELIAPRDVLFLSGDWAPIGPKYALVDLIEDITGISEEALLHVEPLDRFSVAQRLSWAAGRETTRLEDQAYSLLGIFDINMPTLYGEGDRAFRRLQEEIMQRVPDQSLFAWGEIYLGPPIFRSGEHEAVTTTASEMSQRISFQNPVQASPLAKAPSSFAECRAVTANPSHDGAHHIQLEYISSPYGIRTQFHMLPLSLLFPSESIRRHRKQDPEEDSQWYLAILGCQFAKRPGHVVGRVCCITPSDSGVDFVYPASVHILPKSLLHGRTMFPNLFLLPPETLEYCRPHIQPRTVYIPHPDRYDHKASQANTSQPHHSISLLLLSKTREALHAQGYTVDLRGPEENHHSGTHRLTLCHDTHEITVDFNHTLESDGQLLTIVAHVAVSSRNHDVLDPAQESVSPRADPSTVTWTDSIAWRARLGQHGGVKLTVGGAELLILRLCLDLVCAEAYLLHVAVVGSNDSPDTAASSSPPA